PGRSNAFEIAKRLGLKDEVIEKAKTYVSVENNQMEQMIVSLEESKRQAEFEAEEAHRFLQEVETLHRDLERELASYYEQKDDLLEKAERESAQVVEAAKSEAEKVIQDLRKMRLEKHADVK